jgi:drug/metabolite transporter (DMT)-like permease
MTNSSLAVLLGSAFCAAVENVSNKEHQFELFNPPVLVGFALYCVGVVLWLIALCFHGHKFCTDLRHFGFRARRATSFPAYCGLGLIIAGIGLIARSADNK